MHGVLNLQQDEFLKSKLRDAKKYFYIKGLTPAEVKNELYRTLFVYFPMFNMVEN